jgi:hypothetical protein
MATSSPSRRDTFWATSLACSWAEARKAALSWDIISASVAQSSATKVAAHTWVNSSESSTTSIASWAKPYVKSKGKGTSRLAERTRENQVKFLSFFRTNSDWVQDALANHGHYFL